MAGFREKKKKNKQVLYNKPSETANNSDVIKKSTPRAYANVGESYQRQQRKISIYSQQHLYCSKGAQLHQVPSSPRKGLLLAQANFATGPVKLCPSM